MAIGINFDKDDDDYDGAMLFRHWREDDVTPCQPTSNSIEKEKTMIQEIFSVSGVVAPRTRYEVLASLMEEVGELATEVAIEEGYSQKEVGKDGIIGEAIDIITCALDIIWVTHKYLPPEVLENKVRIILKSKLEKWKSKKAQQ